MVDDFIKIIDAITAYGVFPAVVAILIVVVLAVVGYLITTKSGSKGNWGCAGEKRLIREMGTAPLPCRRGNVAQAWQFGTQWYSRICL